jgi:hypothetical protein
MFTLFVVVNGVLLMLENVSMYIGNLPLLRLEDGKLSCFFSLLAAIFKSTEVNLARNFLAVFVSERFSNALFQLIPCFFVACDVVCFFISKFSDFSDVFHIDGILWRRVFSQRLS